MNVMLNRSVFDLDANNHYADGGICYCDGCIRKRLAVAMEYNKVLDKEELTNWIIKGKYIFITKVMESIAVDVLDYYIASHRDNFFLADDPEKDSSYLGIYKKI